MWNPSRPSKDRIGGKNHAIVPEGKSQRHRENGSRGEAPCADPGAASAPGRVKGQRPFLRAAAPSHDNGDGSPIRQRVRAAQREKLTKPSNQSCSTRRHCRRKRHGKSNVCGSHAVQVPHAPSAISFTLFRKCQFSPGGSLGECPCSSVEQEETPHPSSASGCHLPLKGRACPAIAPERLLGGNSACRR